MQPDWAEGVDTPSGQAPLWRWGEYLVGPENAHAVAMLRQCLADFEHGPRLIVLYGPPGSGKSVLARQILQSLAELRGQAPTVRPAQHELRATAPRVWPVVEWDALGFRRRYVGRAGRGALGNWRHDTAERCAVSLDNLEQLAGQAATQRQLTVILDELAERQVLTVMTSREAPWRLERADPRLKSRLMAGLSVGIVSLEGAARCDLLRQLAASKGISIADDVALLISRRVMGSARSMLSAAHGLVQWAERKGAAVDARLAEEYLEKRSRRVRPTVAWIAHWVARRCDVTLRELRGPGRQRRVVRARGLAMLAARKSSGESLARIGAYFGGRDHSTTLHACQRTAELMSDDHELQQAWTELSQAVPR